MQVIKCAHCGASLKLEQGEQIVLCKYCDNINVLDDVIDPNIPNSLIKVGYKIIPDGKFGVCYMVSDILGIPGELYITPREVCFKPMMNVLDKVSGYISGMRSEDLNIKYLKLSDIIGYSVSSLKVLQKFFEIHTNRGTVTFQIVKGSQELVRLSLEQNRQRYFENTEQAIPALTQGNYIRDLGYKEVKSSKKNYTNSNSQLLRKSPNSFKQMKKVYKKRLLIYIGLIIVYVVIILSM